MDASPPGIPQRPPSCVEPVRSASRRPSRRLPGTAPSVPALRPDGTSGLTIEVHRGRARPVVTLHGELDADGEPLFAAIVDHVARTDGPQVLVDLRGVPFADTYGLGPALRDGVTIVDASPRVRRLLAILGAPAPGPVPVPAKERRSFRRSTRARPPRHC